MFKVLHIWNTAGVASIIGKYMDRIYGTKSYVIMRRSFDKFGLTTYGDCFNDSAKFFLLRSLYKAKDFSLIHIHSLDKLVPIIKFLYPKKPVILHYHGSDIRGRWEEKRKYYSKADKIFVSTPDLLEGFKEAIYIPNPVDTELFYPRGKKRLRRAFHIYYNANDIAEMLAKKYNLELVIHNREKDPIPYRKLGEILSEYEYYIDVRRREGRIIRNISKTALEALACGCKVIKYNGEILKELPLENIPEKVVERIWLVYKDLIK